MLESFLNHLFLKLWAGKKKVGFKKRILLSRRAETYGDKVYDLTWSLKYIHSNGQTSHAITIAERASNRNLREVINRIEDTRLPKEIDFLISKHSHNKEEKNQ